MVRCALGTEASWENYRRCSWGLHFEWRLCTAGTDLPQVRKEYVPLLTIFRAVHGQRLLQQNVASFISSSCISTLNM